MREKRRQAFDALRLHTPLPKDLRKLVLSYHSSSERLILHDASKISFPDANNVLHPSRAEGKVNEYRWSIVPYDTDPEMNLIDRDLHHRLSLVNLATIIGFGIGHMYLWRYKDGFVMADNVWVYHYPTIFTPFSQAVRVPSMDGDKNLVGNFIYRLNDDNSYSVMNLETDGEVPQYEWHTVRYAWYTPSHLSYAWNNRLCNIDIQRVGSGSTVLAQFASCNPVATDLEAVPIPIPIQLGTGIESSCYKVEMVDKRIYFVTRGSARRLMYMKTADMKLGMTSSIPNGFLLTDCSMLVFGNRLCLFKSDTDAVKHGAEYHPETDSWHKVDCNVALDRIGIGSLQMIEFDQSE